jgi:hypothetical protein
MSASQTRRARADRTARISGAAQIDAEIAKQETAIPATPELFATSGTPHAAEMGRTGRDTDREWEDKVRMMSAEAQWSEFWAAADSGEPLPDSSTADADGGDRYSGSVLAGLMLERFDDDENWRKLARTGRAL